MSELPGDLRYTSDHEWLRQEEDGSVTVGITDHAQSALGDLVYVELPEAGQELEAGGEMRSWNPSKRHQMFMHRSRVRCSMSMPILLTTRRRSMPIPTEMAGSFDCNRRAALIRLTRWTRMHTRHCSMDSKPD